MRLTSTNLNSYSTVLFCRLSDADSLEGGSLPKAPGRKPPRTPDIQERASGAVDPNVPGNAGAGWDARDAIPSRRDTAVGGTSASMSPGGQALGQLQDNTHLLPEVSLSFAAPPDRARERRSRSLLLVPTSHDLEVWGEERDTGEPSSPGGGLPLPAVVLPVGEGEQPSADPDDKFSTSLPATPSQPMAPNLPGGLGADVFDDLLYRLPVDPAVAVKRSEGKLLLLKQRQKRGAEVDFPLKCQ